MSETFEVDELQNHPKSIEAYGQPDPDDDMLDDMADVGMRTDPKVAKNSHFVDGPVIIGGHRRIKAAKECGIKLVDCEVETYRTSADELEAIRQDNNYRDKMFSDRMGEYDLIKDAEEQAAKERQGNRETSSSSELEVNRQSRDAIAEKIGIGSGSTLTRAVKIWDYAHEREEHENIPPQLAEWMVADIDDGEESITGCYNTLRDLEKEVEEPDEPQEEEAEEEIQESDENKDKYSIIDSAYGDSGLVERIKSYVAEKDISKSVVLEMKELTGEDGTASEFQNRLWFDQGDIDELPSEEDDSDEEEEEEEPDESSSESDESEDSSESEETREKESEQSDESSESSDTQTEETDESEDMERSEETDEESDTEVHETEYVNGEDDSDDGEMVSVDMDAQTAEVISDVAEQNDSTPAEVLEEVTQPDAIDKMHDGEQSYDEHFSEEEKEMHKHRERRHQALMDHEHTVKMGELKDNWDAYGHAADHIAKAECPHPECDNGIEHLTWDCHGYSFEEAYGKAQEEYQDAVDDMPSAEEVLKEMDGYKGYTFDPEEDTFEDINNKEKQITEGETDD